MSLGDNSYPSIMPVSLGGFAVNAKAEMEASSLTQGNLSAPISKTSFRCRIIGKTAFSVWFTTTFPSGFSLPMRYKEHLPIALASVPASSRL
jgi:hypothetical protein